MVIQPKVIIPLPQPIEKSYNRCDPQTPQIKFGSRNHSLQLSQKILEKILLNIITLLTVIINYLPPFLNLPPHPNQLQKSSEYRYGAGTCKVEIAIPHHCSHQILFKIGAFCHQQYYSSTKKVLSGIPLGSYLDLIHFNLLSTTFRSLLPIW